MKKTLLAFTRNRATLALVLIGLSAATARALKPSAETASPASPTVQLTVDNRPLPPDHKENSYAPVVRGVAPSVVQIDTTAKLRPPAAAREFPGWNHPFFRRYFDDQHIPQPAPNLPRQRGLGSGVIVTPDGYILTNNHLVENAQTVRVTFHNGRELDANVVGTDPKTDVAVLKVEASNLPFATMADSDQLEVGDFVLAIGSPFGLGQTVTLGIVSATGRATLGLDYEDFIQTDAAINPGNSGGALIDTAGRLVGINTAILTRSGGNQGIGFAIPANLARDVMQDLVQEGRVTRGYIGVMIQDLTPTLAQAFKLNTDQGALVADVVPNGPADQAGLRNGDVIVEFNHAPVQDSRRLKFAVASVAPGESVPVRILRDGQKQRIDITVRQQTDDPSIAQANPDPTSDVGKLKGVALADLTNGTRAEFNVPESVRGALIARVEPDSTADEAGLRPGDVILEINRQPVESAAAALRLTRDSTLPATLLRIWRDGASRYVVVDESSHS